MPDAPLLSDGGVDPADPLDPVRRTDPATRWRWISYNPIDAAQPPVAKPPKADSAIGSSSSVGGGRRLGHAGLAGDDHRDSPWRGVCAAQVRPRPGRRRPGHPAQRLRAGPAEKDTKTHQRRIALDEETIGVLRAHLARLDARAEALQADPDTSAFLFSYSLSSDIPIHPSSVTHGYSRLVRRLGITTTLHKLRHYNATELIAAGVDIRTIAGRLGHGGGGATTLSVYAAWVSEADQRAAKTLGDRLRPR